MFGCSSLLLLIAERAPPATFNTLVLSESVGLIAIRVVSGCLWALIINVLLHYILHYLLITANLLWRIVTVI